MYMLKPDRDIAIEKIKEMPIDRLLKVLIFMAGMEAEKSSENERTTECSE